MKKKLLYVLTVLSFILAPVWAQDRTEVGTLDDLKQALSEGKTEIQLTAEISIDQDVNLESTSKTTIYAAENERHFTVDEGIKVSMKNLIIKDGNKISDTERGGAIKNYRGILIMEDCSLIGNKTEGQGGGAIYLQQGEMTLIRCNLSGNICDDWPGGAIYQFWGELKLIDCNLSENKATGGGAIFGYYGKLAVIGCSFTKNTTTEDEGGALNLSGKTFINNCIITGNKAAGYSAVNANSADGCVILNTTISGNESEKDDESGAAFFTYQNITILNSIIAGNKLSNGSMWDISVYNDTKKITMHNSIYGTASANTTFDPASSGNHSGIASSLVFANPANGDYTLRPYSDNPAINGGDNDRYDTKAKENGEKKLSEGAIDVNKDLRLYGDKIDIGAYELQTEPLPAPIPPVYHTVTLEVAPGIDLYSLSPGQLTVEEGGHLQLQFLPENQAATAADVLFLVDGIETAFKDFGGSNYYSYILNPINQDHSILIAMKEYTVTLPDIEGVTIDVGPGEHPVAYGDSFTFSLTPAEGVEPENVHVYANGTEVMPEPLRAITLTYTIDKVIGPVTIEIEGAGDPVGNIQANDAKAKVYATDGCLVVETSTLSPVRVYTAAGKPIANRIANGTLNIHLPAGIYLVQVGKEMHKVVIY